MAEADILARVTAQLDAAPTSEAPQQPQPQPQTAQAEAEDYSGLVDDLDPPEGPQVEGDEAPAPDVVELDLGGSVQRLTKAELANALKEHGELKQTAQTLYQQRQAVEQERAITAQIAQVAPIVESLRAEGRLVMQMMQGLNQELQQLKESDPIAAFQKREQINELQVRFNQLAQQEQNASGHVEQMHRQAHMQKMQAELPVLMNKLPKWKDPERREADIKFIREHLRQEGYPDYMVNGLTDARMVVTALKAAKYDAIMSKSASKKVEGAPQLARPGAAANPGLAAATNKLNYRKAIRSAKTDSDRSKIIQKRVEGML